MGQHKSFAVLPSGRIKPRQKAVAVEEADYHVTPPQSLVCGVPVPTGVNGQHVAAAACDSDSVILTFRLNEQEKVHIAV